MAKRESRFPELSQLFVEMRRFFIGVGAFSFVINLLQFTAPLYMLQVYDRVLASYSTTTLLVLTILVVGLFVLMAILEFIRSRVLVRVGAAMEAKINQRIFDAAFEATLRRGGRTRGRRLLISRNFASLSPATVPSPFSMHRGFRSISRRALCCTPGSVGSASFQRRFWWC